MNSKALKPSQTMGNPRIRCRAKKPKVRSGCLVCKARKVKCDETKPGCVRCTKLGTSCTYGPQSTVPKAHSRRVTFIPIKPRHLKLRIARNPSVSIPGDELETRYFQLFREKLSSDLCGYFESSFWTCLIPQECHLEPAVRHAICALGALYKSSASRFGATDPDDRHLMFALEQHSKAINAFRVSLAGGKPQVRLALIASLLFGSFESFHGNWETASQQIKGGLSILSQWQKSKFIKTTNKTALVLDPELGIALSRLQLQLESFRALNPMNNDPIEEITHSDLLDDIPVRFASINDGFRSALSIATHTLRHIRRATRSIDMEHLQESVAREHDTLREALDGWRKAFRPPYLEVETERNVKTREYLGANLLHTCILTFDIMFSTSLERDECVFDLYTEQFRRILSLCRRNFRLDEELLEQDGLRAQFGMGLIMTLYYLATRCRVSVMRREAISILRQWPRKNGIWDSLQAAKVAEWIVSVEEEGCDKDGYVPEETRVRMNSLKVVQRSTRLDVECIQGPENGIATFRMASLVLS